MPTKRGYPHRFDPNQDRLSAPADHDGRPKYMVEVELDILRVYNPGIDKVEQKAEQDKKNLADAVTKEMSPTACPGPSDVRVVIGGVEIGPNGELIKGAIAIADVGRRVSEEATKIIKTPGKAIKDTPSNVAREVHHFFSKVL